MNFYSFFAERIMEKIILRLFLRMNIHKVFWASLQLNSLNSPCDFGAFVRELELMNVIEYNRRSNAC